MSGARLRVAAVELPGAPGDATARRAAARAALPEGAQLVVLPEAWWPGYAHQRVDTGGDAREVGLDLARASGAWVAFGYLHGDGSWLGLAGPDGSWARYRKRFPSPAEARWWRGGGEPGVFQTPLGRVGVAVCADVLQLATWRGLVGVDVVLVAAAWPDYRGRRAPPGLGWVAAQSNRYRDEVLAAGARALGAPVVFANASGPWRGEEGFSGGSGVWDATGRRVAGAGQAVEVEPGRAGPPLRHPARWRAFTAVYRWGARAVSAGSRLAEGTRPPPRGSD